MTRKTTPILALASAGLLAVTGAAFAHEMDADGDGNYTLEEIRSDFADLTEEDYALLDTNGDGVVDAEEIEAARADGPLKPAE